MSKERIGGTLGFLTNAAFHKNKSRISAAIKESQKRIAPILGRIYPRSLGGPLREHYRLPGNQQNRAFADVIYRQLELGLTIFQVTKNSLEILKDRRGVSTSQVAGMRSWLLGIAGMIDTIINK